MNNPEQHIYHRFQDVLADRSKASDESSGRPVFHADPGKRAAVHAVLKAIHEHIFENDGVKDLSQARERHAAIVALSEPEEDS